MSYGEIIVLALFLALLWSVIALTFWVCKHPLEREVDKQTSIL